jgi:hypothetical protein
VHFQYKWGIVSGARSSSGTEVIDETAIRGHVLVGRVLTLLSESLLPSITLLALLGMYVIGLTDIPITAATGADGAIIEES